MAHTDTQPCIINRHNTTRSYNHTEYQKIAYITVIQHSVSALVLTDCRKT